MGGGRSSRRSLTPERYKQLEEKAKGMLAAASEPSRRSVFISFCFEDINHVNLLRGQAKNDNSELEFIDRSLHEPFDSERAEYIKAGIKERIQQGSVTLVYLSSDTCNSQWVDWEIRESVRLGKGVVGVYQGSKPKELPAALQESRAEVVPWEHEALNGAIDRASKRRS